MNEDKSKTYILVTGGCGYIGSHVVLELCKKDYNVIVVDNFSNSYPAVKENLHKSMCDVTFLELDLITDNLYDHLHKYKIDW